MKRKEEEWQILRSIINEDNKILSSFAVKTLFGSVGWFKLIVSLDLITEWLKSDLEQNRKRAIYLMRNRQKEVPEIVAPLLSSYNNLSNKCNSLVNEAIHYGELGTNRQIFEILS